MENIRSFISNNFALKAQYLVKKIKPAVSLIISLIEILTEQ
jgi:hypothetical protein